MTSVVDYLPGIRQSHSSEWLFCILLLLLPGCETERPAEQLSGATMGTTWHITYVPQSDAPPKSSLLDGIEERLVAINDSMSTYQSDSEILRFNALAVGPSQRVSEPFLTVLNAALQVGSQSQGAYDVTVAPLVSLWGFGPAGVVIEPPTAEKVIAALSLVGQQHVTVGEDGSVSKTRPLALDFSSLAKGYAVDVVAQWLSQQGVEHYLVEIGGEMRVAGSSPRGDLWHIGIEQPAMSGRSVAAALSLTDRAVATSGDYRNYFELDGVRYSHSIDPRSGYPVVHDLVSVTVVHASAMTADAWATALTVLGGEQAMAVAQKQGLAVYFIRRVDGRLVHSSTAAFADYIADDGAKAQVEIREIR